MNRPPRRPSALTQDERLGELAATLCKAYFRLKLSRDQQGSQLDSCGVPEASCEPVDGTENQAGKEVA